jgi:diguanylate cyclase (GGDEF)-like protein
MTVLLIEDSDVDSALVDRMMASVSGVEIGLEVQPTLAGGLARLAHDGVDLVLLDLSLPDSRGLATFARLQAAAPALPVIVMSADEDDALALEAVRLGAQDYLAKGHVTTASLGRAVRYALERHRLVSSLRGLSLVDDLTGLYNRRGFMTLAEAHLRVAMRAGRRFLLVYADLDGLKQINDTLGHRYGDEALVKMGEVLRTTFRQSDIIARLGGDEFVVLAAEAGNDTEHALLARLESQLNAFNAGSGLPFRVWCSAGVAEFDAASTCSLEEMLVRADQLLYQRKRERKRVR